MADQVEVDSSIIIGYGTFGKVYASKCRKYAFKVFEEADLDYEDDRKFLAICQGHPNIVKIFDIHNPLKKPVIVMELAECNLDTYRRKNDDIPVMEIGLQLFKGLEFIHSKNIVHADIKEENVLVFEDGKRVAIADFGASLKIEEMVVYYPITTTITHRAPELLACQQKWDQKIDIWSMGVVYYYLLDGSKFMRVYSEPIHCLHYITKTLGWIPFDDPPLPFIRRYWSDIYKYDSPSVCLDLEPTNSIIDATLVPLPKDRKTASEIVCLLQKLLIKTEIFKNNNPERFSSLYSFPQKNKISLNSRK